MGNSSRHPQSAHHQTETTVVRLKQLAFTRRVKHGSVGSAHHQTETTVLRLKQLAFTRRVKHASEEAYEQADAKAGAAVEAPPAKAGLGRTRGPKPS